VIADEPVSMVDASMRSTIVECLRRLHVDCGISFVYITHDLATAHQVSRDLMVLYRGRVVESGETTEVVARPAHPYTQDLLAAIPGMEPGTAWLAEERAGAGEAADNVGQAGCPYATRCNDVMDRCRRASPRTSHLEGSHRVVCLLGEPAAPRGAQKGPQ
jgi:peptide/nickel transport system ATP-binding protein